MRREHGQSEHCRSPRRLAVGFEETTTIFGEHACGKNSVLASLAMVLDPSRDGLRPVFSESDFHEADGARASCLSLVVWFRRK